MGNSNKGRCAKINAQRAATAEANATQRAQLAENSKIRLSQLANEHEIAKQQMRDADAQHARAYAKEMEEMKNNAIAQQDAHKKEVKRRQHEHEESMKQMQIAASAADKERKIQQKKESLAKIANTTSELNKAVHEDKENLITTEQTLGETQASLKKNAIDIQEFPKKKVIAMDIYEKLKDIDYQRKKDAYDHDNDEIKAAIESTGLNEDNVGQFLKLTHNLVAATVVTQANTNNLDTKLQTFNDLIEMITSDRLTIENHFNDKKLARFVPIMDEAGMEDMDQMVCDNDEEYQEIVEMVKEGLQEQLAQWNEANEDSKTDEKPPSDKMSFAEKRTMKGICLKSEKTWINDQNMKKSITKRSLMSVSPVMSKFFGGCYEGMNQVQEMMSFDRKLNDSQRKAIKMIGNVKDDDEKKDHIEDARDSWDIDSNVQIYSESQNAWFVGQIVKVFNDNEGEWLNVEYETGQDTINVDVQRGSDKVKALENVKTIVPESDLQVAMHDEDLSDELVVECRALSKAAVFSVSVIETMEEEFNANKSTLRARSVAMGVQDSCKQIIVSEGAIRQSVLLAQKIMTYKPANMKNETTRKSWDALDTAIIHIFKSALEMVDVSVKYFAFFLKFKSSFEYFDNCYDGDEDPSLSMSCEYIRTDVRKFCAFSNEFTKTVVRLRTDAMNCIEDCVRKKNGYESFAMAKESRKKTVDAYLVAKAKVDAYSYEWDQTLEDYRLDRISLSGNEKKLLYQQTFLENRIKENNEFLKNLDKQKVALDAMNI